MSISPFSSSQIKSLEDLFEKNGFKVNGLNENNFRYSISTKEKVIVFTLKFPIELPIRLNIPFEIINFKISLAFNLWSLTENTYKILIYFMKVLRSLALQASIEHQFPMGETERNNLVKILNKILPDTIENENERAWINRIRLSFFNKRNEINEFNNSNINDLVKTLKKAGLIPTFKQPWEIKTGIPKIRTSETLIFSNEETEYFILEKGFFTYFKDLEYNRFYLRSLFESYSPYILEELYGNLPDFNIQTYVENWIKFARLLLNSIIEIIDAGDFNKNDFVEFRCKNNLDPKAFELHENNFAFSALYYESIISKDLYPLHNDLFNSPPANFEVIESLNYLSLAEELIKKFEFKKASNLFNKALIIFNKNHQKKVIVSILLQMRKLASYLNQNEMAINYLQNALNVAKSGEIPINYILKIHYRIGKAYYKIGEYDNAIKHFKLLITFLEKEKPDVEKGDYLGMSFLYIGLISVKQNNIQKSLINFKNALYIGNKYSDKVKLKYYLFRANNFKNKGNLSQAHKFLRLAYTEIKSINTNLLVDLFLELGDFYTNYRKDSKKAIYFLDTAKKYLSLKTIPKIKKTIRWNLIMSDYNQFLLKNKNYELYLERSKKLKDQLRTIGINE